MRGQDEHDARQEMEETYGQAGQGGCDDTMLPGAAEWDRHEMEKASAKKEETASGTAT